MTNLESERPPPHNEPVAQALNIGTKILSAGIAVVKAAKKMGMFDPEPTEADMMREVYEKHPILRPKKEAATSNESQPEAETKEKKLYAKSLARHAFAVPANEKRKATGKYLRPCHLKPMPLKQKQAASFEENLKALGRILRTFQHKGWRISELHLKKLHATSPDGKMRFWFSRQNGRSILFSRREDAPQWNYHYGWPVVRHKKGISYKNLDPAMLVKDLLKFTEGSHMPICGMPSNPRPPPDPRGYLVQRSESPFFRSRPDLSARPIQDPFAVQRQKDQRRKEKRDKVREERLFGTNIAERKDAVKETGS